MGLYYKNKFTIKTFASEISAKEITHFQRTKEGYIEFYSVIHCNGCDEMYQWGNPIEYGIKHTDQDVINIINALGAEYNGNRPFAHIKFNDWQNDIRTIYTGYKTTPDDIGAHESDGEAYCYSCHDKLTEKVGEYGEKLNKMNSDNTLNLHKLDADLNKTKQSNGYDFIVLNKQVYTRGK
jgi:hypothetical protein